MLTQSPPSPSTWLAEDCCFLFQTNIAMHSKSQGRKKVVLNNAGPEIIFLIVHIKFNHILRFKKSKLA